MPEKGIHVGESRPQYLPVFQPRPPYCIHQPLSGAEIIFEAALNSRRKQIYNLVQQQIS
jgi:hypothetical protein